MNLAPRLRLEAIGNGDVVLDKTGSGFRRLDECFRKLPGIILELPYGVLSKLVLAIAIHNLYLLLKLVYLAFEVRKSGRVVWKDLWMLFLYLIRSMMSSDRGLRVGGDCRIVEEEVTFWMMVVNESTETSSWLGVSNGGLPLTD